MNTKCIEDYNKETQRKILNMLKAYDEVNVVTYDSGRQEVETGVILTAFCDRVNIVTFYKDDIYTKEEQILNYVRAFADFPIEYKGERDYTMLEQVFHLEAARAPYTLSFDDNGDIVLTEGEKNE